MKNPHKGFIVSLILIIAVLIIGGGVAYVYENAKLADSTATATTTASTPIETTTTSTTDITILTKVVTSNLFSYQSEPGDKVGGMILSKINHPTSQTEPASPGYVYAEFTGTVTVIGRLSAPTGNPEDIGMGPQYSLNNLTSDSLKKLPYLQSDTRTVWFGVKNPDVMKNFSVKNRDLVEMTINKYEYVFFPAGFWNAADVVTVRKIQ